MTKTNDTTNIAVIQNTVKYISDKVDSIDHKLEGNYITRVEFEPIKKIVYGVVGILGAATLGAILKLIFIK